MSNTAVLYTDHGFGSPYAMSAYVALAEKGVDVELIKVDLDHGAQHRPDYLGLSMTGKVPTLVHDGFALSESSAIAEYIDDTFQGTALYPKDRLQRARARQVQAWLRTDLGAIREERSSGNLFAKPAHALPALSAPARQAADKLIAAAEQLLPAGSVNLFEHWSIADLDLSLMLNRMVAVGDPMPARLVEYVRHQWSRPSVQRWVALDRTPATAAA
ncbi:glutathione transferase [Castellaniella caeni]|uniref:glutathione transferase n=1 Tax=Castellaniella caeni TaxID=266123 RepID=UPI00083462DA|nr:glutathione transferase [Castellaniella caeni]